MALNVRKSLAFLLGFGFACLPAVGPFLAVPFMLLERLRLGRLDVLWLTAALISGASFSYHGAWNGFGFGVLQVLGPWLVYRAFRGTYSLPFLSNSAGVMASGIVAGFAVITLVGWLGLEFNFAYPTLSQAVLWTDSPALYGHAMLVMGGLIAVLMPKSALRFVGLAMSALGILVSGSREAAIGWVLLMGLLFVINGKRPLKRYLPELALITMMLVMVAGIGSFLGWGRMGFLLDVSPDFGTRTNLVRGSETPQGDWWDARGVSVETAQVDLGQLLTRYDVSKTQSAGWHRLQQVIPVERGVPYTLSVWLKPDDSQPGLQGWGQLSGRDTRFVVSAALVGDTWQASKEGPGRILEARIVERRGAWQRVMVSFVYEGSRSPLYWYVGLAPDSRDVLARASFAGFQLEKGEQASLYAPGAATRALSLGTARVPVWQQAWRGFVERPWWGHGVAVFDDFYAERLSAQQISAVPSHAHNLYLNILFERGLLGLLSLLLLGVALSVVAFVRRDLPFLAVLGVVLLVNVFDVSLFYGSVLYPLVAVAGWRSATYKLNPAQDTASRQLFIKLTLAAADLGMALTAFLLADRLRVLLGGGAPIANLAPEKLLSILATLLLWPATAWLQGLYPAYGVGAAKELSKQVGSAVYAGLILSVGVLLFNRELPLPRTTLAWLIIFSLVLLPLGRALTKRLLHAAGIWGRPVILLGAGALGQSVARALYKRPLDGLTPIALFEAAPKTDLVDAIPVLPGFDHARHFAADKGVKHLIVTTPPEEALEIRKVLQKSGSLFNTVQFVPNLQAVPLPAVGALSLDDLLSLELRNDLNSRLNHAGKRLFDIVAVSLGTLLISPLLLALAVVVYVNSPGPIFYGHARLGRGGRYFKAWKFRSMATNGDDILRTYLAKHPEAKAEWDATQKLQNDPRVTRIGAFLRKYSLDELPQLWNVLVGDMSLVGPRPIVEKEVIKYAEAINLYASVRPGITGYWQVSGRSNTDYEERVALDSFYVYNWSIWLDLVILIRTPQAVVKAEGAY